MKRLSALAACLALATPACAQTAPTAPGAAERQAYRDRVQAAAEGAHLRAPSATEANWAFTCLGRRHLFAIEVDASGRVSLVEIGGDFGPISTSDRSAIQAELDRWSGVDTVTLQCGEDGRYGFLVSGRGQGPDGAPRPERLRRFRFDQGRLTDVQP